MVDVLEGGQNLFMNLVARSFHVKMELGGSLSSHVRAAPLRENWNNFILITSFGTLLTWYVSTMSEKFLRCSRGSS